MKLMNLSPGKWGGLRIGRMLPEDIDEVYLLETHCFPQPWSKGIFISELEENHLAEYLVLRAGKRIWGYTGMWIILDEAHITTLAVMPELRRRGLGETLLNALMHTAAKKGVVKYTLEVRVSNYPARRLYEKCGFTVKGIRKKYYHNEDAYIMWKDLIG